MLLIRATVPSSDPLDNLCLQSMACKFGKRDSAIHCVAHNYHRDSHKVASEVLNDVYRLCTVYANNALEPSNEHYSFFAEWLETDDNNVQG